MRQPGISQLLLPPPAYPSSHRFRATPVPRSQYNHDAAKLYRDTQWSCSARNRWDRNNGLIAASRMRRVVVIGRDRIVKFCCFARGLQSRGSGAGALPKRLPGPMHNEVLQLPASNWQGCVSYRMIETTCPGASVQAPCSGPLTVNFICGQDCRVRIRHASPEDRHKDFQTRQAAPAPASQPAQGWFWLTGAAPD